MFYLLKGNNKFIWTDDCKTAFGLLKEALITAPILAYPDYDKKFIVQKDASLTAIGGILSQINDEGEEYLIGYCSRTLNVHKRNYIITKHKCLTIIHSYKQFKVYLHGTKFTVVTDHASLRWLQNLKELEGCLARWALKLKAYNYDIQHRAGIKHQNANGLSCMPLISHLIDESERIHNLLYTPDA